METSDLRKIEFEAGIEKGIKIGKDLQEAEFRIRNEERKVVFENAFGLTYEETSKIYNKVTAAGMDLEGFQYALMLLQNVLKLRSQRIADETEIRVLSGMLSATDPYDVKRLDAIIERVKTINAPPQKAKE